MTACSPVDRLLQTILVEAPGATEAVVSLQLFNTMDEFFRRTQAWQYQTEIVLEEGAIEYTFMVPVDSAFVRMISVSYQSVPVPPSSAVPGAEFQVAGRMAADLTFPDGDAKYNVDGGDINPGTGIFTYAIHKPQTITITVPPSSAQAQFPLNAWMALSVAKECIECVCGDWQLPDWMYDMYFQDLLDGTLARLMSMPNKPWSNTTLAGYHAKRFRNAMAYRKQEATRGFAYNIPGWRFPRVGGWV